MATSNIVVQAAAVAISDGRICLVTTTKGKGWIIPKGHCEPGDSSQQTAVIEAWEEAGVSGPIAAEPLGDYSYERSGKTYRVTVHVMDVETIADRWPERKKRKRRWLPLHEACDRIEHPQLRKLLRRAVSRRAG